MSKNSFPDSSPSSPTPLSLNEQLVAAAGNNKHESVSELLKNPSVDPNYKMGLGFKLACSRAFPKVVVLFIEDGRVNPKVRAGPERTFMDAVCQLTEWGERNDVSEKFNFDEYTAFELAAFSNDTEVLKMITPYYRKFN